MTLPDANGSNSEQRPSVDYLKAAACAEIDRRAAEIVATSTRIQQHPETGFFEFDTSRVVQEEFTRMGLAFEAGLARTGVKARMSGASSALAVGILGELDALVTPDSPIADP